jgi:hypothetical protein
MDHSSRRKRFLKNRKGYSGIIAAIFMVLIVLFLYFNVYTFMQDRNNAFQDTVSQVAQIDTDRNAEQLSILANPTPTVNGSQVNVIYDVENTGPLAVQIVRLWVLASPDNTTGNTTMNLALQPGGSNSSIIPVNISFSANATFTIHFVTARGNIFSPNRNPPSVGFVGSVTVSSQFPYPVSPGSSANYSIAVYRGLLNGSFSASLSISQLPTPTSYTFSPSMLFFASNDTVKTSTLTIYTNVSTPLASSVFAVTATNTADSNDRASGFGTLTVGGPSPRETGSIKMDWTTLKFYDFGTAAPPMDGTNITTYVRSPPDNCSLPKDHYIMFAALFTNLDPEARDISLTADSCIWAINPSEGTVKNPLLLPIVNVTNGIYSSRFNSLVLYYNKPTMVYFFDSSGTIPKESYYSGGAIPLSIIFYGNTSTGYYGQNIPWIAIKFT